MKRFELNDGHSIPALGLGTWKAASGDETYAAVKTAIAVGYRHIDCAMLYANEADVGRAIQDSIKDGVVRREDLFVTSKYWNSAHSAAGVQSSLRNSLTDLGLEYLDLYLMHWPIALRDGVTLPSGPKDFIPLSECTLASTWAATEGVKAAGLCRSIGVSNFGPQRLSAFIETVDTPPAVNQVELHPYNPQPELLSTCESLGVHLTAYSPLGSLDRPAMMKQANEPALLHSDLVTGIATDLGVTPAQVLIAWAISRGTSVIPKSANPERIAQNLAAAEVTLPDTAKQALDSVEARFRFVDPKGLFIKGVNFDGDSFWD
jgi:alcohol dehydrogenase (NADP+)